MTVRGLFSVLSANNLLFIIAVPNKKAEQGNYIPIIIPSSLPYM